MLQVRDLRVGYHGTPVVHGVDLTVAEGSVTSIIGPNGSGKSTVLKAVTRTVPSTGSVRLAGEDVGVLSRRRMARLVSMVGQVRETPADMTVTELVGLGRSPHRPWFHPLGARDRRIVAEVIEQAGLQQFRDRTVATLSGGEAQRAWIAMALAQRPRLLLLDEPTTYLDIAHQLEVLDLVRSINADLGLTVVMVLHDLNHAGFYSDHLVVLDHGRVVTTGAPSAVLSADLVEQVYGLRVEIDHPRGDDWPRIHTLPTGSLL
ncbi:MAG TPA: ABC transporter ATP-binding protein [Bacillota bacterium]|nr:ABC transporter ATP-binding protein [Bacillota bacterium]